MGAASNIQLIHSERLICLKLSHICFSWTDASLFRHHEPVRLVHFFKTFYSSLLLLSCQLAFNRAAGFVTSSLLSRVHSVGFSLCFTVYLNLRRFKTIYLQHFFIFFFFSLFIAFTEVLSRRTECKYCQKI